MNKYEHSEQSALIFGGTFEEYLPVHELVDMNKVVSPSIFGRFFLHHYDVGKIILEKVFGEKLENGVLVEDILLQHLFEDYDQVLTFKDNWSSSFNETKLPQISDERDFFLRASKEGRLSGLSVEQIIEIDDFFHLKTIASHLALKNPLAVLGHALGADLAVKILGKRFYNLWTSDVVVGYLNCRFTWSDVHKEKVPSLLDYEKAVFENSWIHAPRNYLSRVIDPKETKEKILKFKETKKQEDLKVPSKKEARRISQVISRAPCNYD